MTKAIEGDYDIVEGGHTLFNENCSLQSLYNREIVEGGHTLFNENRLTEKVLPNGSLFGFPWGKVYKAQI